MTNTTTKKSLANTIGHAYGTEMTKAIASGDMAGFRNLFVNDRPVLVVLQDAQGNEAEFTIADAAALTAGDDDVNATMTWEDFRDMATKDLQDQDYAKTETQCLGTLGNRMIMETGRFNNSGEVYLVAYQLISFDDDGKITAVELFSDPSATTLFEAASASSGSEQAQDD